MRVLLTVDPEIPVPPIHYGGIERIVDLLGRSLIRRGHEVTLAANGTSTTAIPLSPFIGRSSLRWTDTLLNMLHVSRQVAAGRFDIVHSFSRLAYLAPLLLARFPILMSYQRAVTQRTVKMAQRLSRGKVEFTGISRSMIAPVSHIGKWHLVYNAVDLSQYDFVARALDGAPLVWLGRLEHIKGPHLAIEVAQRCAKPLILAGNVPKYAKDYFEAKIKPHLGPMISYVGPVTDADKNNLLGKASALLMPILWEEPFGIVMAEALACGTPVIGLRRGSVPEVVIDGITGFVCDSVDEMVRSVGRLGELDRVSSRSHTDRFFNGEVMTDSYLTIYSNILGRDDVAHSNVGHG